MNTAPNTFTTLMSGTIPPPTPQVRRLMLALGMTMEGYLDQEPEISHPALLHSVMARGANVIIAGTRCRRPLLCGEMVSLAAQVDSDAIIVRAADEPKLATFDIMLRHTHRPLLGYRLWLRQPMGSAWLIPTGGERTFVRLGGLGLELSREAPYFCDLDAARGLKEATDYLSIAQQGWF